MKRINGFVVMLLVTVLLSACGGGGGGGGVVVPVGGGSANAPVISNLQYSPTGAYLNSGGGTATINATFDFSDINSNVSTLTVLVFDASGVMVDSSTNPVGGIGGLPFGTIQITGAVDTSVLGNFTFQLYLTDTGGLRSNVLSGTFRVSDQPWKSKANRPSGQIGVAASLNGSIYHIYWQYDIPSATGVTVLETYNTATDTWSTKTTLPISQGGFDDAVALNGKIYGIGGAPSPVGGAALEEYDPLTDTWTLKAPMPNPRSNCSASVVNGKIYVIGGSSAGTYLNSVDVYDPLTNSWSSVAPMPTPRENLTASVVNGRIYAIGGYNLSGYLSTVEEFNPLTGVWVSKAPMPYPPMKGMVSGAINGRIYVVGGMNGSLGGSYSLTREYDPASNTWKEKTSASADLATVVNDKLYAFQYAVVNTFEYTPANDLL